MYLDNYLIKSSPSLINFHPILKKNNLKYNTNYNCKKQKRSFPELIWKIRPILT